jgi:hypothetical protein
MDLIKHLTIYLATGVEACAAVVIALAAVQATFQAIRLFFVRLLNRKNAKSKFGCDSDGGCPCRWNLNSPADILRTAVAPTWDEIGKLPPL